jgi:hypothetical protein
MVAGSSCPSTPPLDQTEDPEPRSQTAVWPAAVVMRHRARARGVASSIGLSRASFWWGRIHLAGSFANSRVHRSHADAALSGELSIRSSGCGRLSSMANCRLSCLHFAFRPCGQAIEGLAMPTASTKPRDGDTTQTSKRSRRSGLYIRSVSELSTRHSCFMTNPSRARDQASRIRGEVIGYG